ncbi:RNA-directed DNA polymerase (reverse transcriptase)-related family protein [Rhynchospora pubera]|uniref:RNA-directed DNA polymerase (Reverse transcriptase)-related family protein n=1 Tax=Rhynchospora pubera TaxID=906938 RepID=A0AAV8DG64_9POAL|nr:RNA-directed DNA polymerase (reverse transcriptase)-related family protein [Rhynchospora pubera]
MINSVALAVDFSISSKLTYPFHLLQYADDTLLFSTTKGNALQSLSLVLNTFSRISGIEINWSKTSFVPFNIQPHELQQIATVLNCAQTTLPLVYLGLPLTAKKPSRVCFQVLIDKVNLKLASWKSALLSRAGRIVLASSVLSSIPIYFMSVFQLPAWVIKAIDKVRRIFIWQGTTGKGLPLLSWSRVCLPKNLGGFGLIDLRLQNIALLLRWLWRLYSQPSSLWSMVAKLLFAKRNNSTPPLGWNSNGSFFWRQLGALRFYFQISTRIELCNGNNTLFWFDNWGGTNLCFFQHPNCVQNSSFLTVRTARRNWFNLFPAPMTQGHDLLFRQLHGVRLTQGMDKFVWKWSSDGKYSSSTTYEAFISAGKVQFYLKNLWQLRIPPNVKTFLLLLAHDRLLTQCQLLKRNIVFQPHCHLCQHDILETAEHLFCSCPFSASLWSSLALDNIALLGVQHLLQYVCSLNRNDVTSVRLATALWSLWLERNNRIFRNSTRTVQGVHDWLVQEAALFYKFT